MTSGPGWLGGAVAAGMLLVAAYCASRILVARRRGRATSYSVDVFHVAMGVAMAGMLAPGLGVGTGRDWTFGFGGFALWFALRAASDGRRGRRSAATPWTHLAHVGSSATMIYMLGIGPAAAGTPSSASSALSSSSSMSGMHISGTGAAPVIGVVLVVFLAAYSAGLIERLPLTPALATPTASPTLAPRIVACCQVAMNVAMGYMLIALL